MNQIPTKAARSRLARLTGKRALCIVLATSLPAFAAADPDEAMERARRAAERVLEVIRQDASSSRSARPEPEPTTAPAPGSKAAPAAKPVRRPPQKPPTPTTNPAGSSASEEEESASAATARPAPQADPAGTQVLFDFETGVDGMALYEAGNPVPMQGGSLELSSLAAHGKQSLVVRAPRAGRIGQQFGAPRDWSKFRQLVFLARTRQQGDLLVGLNVGSDWSWCPMRAVAGESVGPFTVFRATLGGRTCPNYDGMDVWSFYLEIPAPDVLALDHVRLQP